MRRLFVFRPEPGASRTVARARAMGLEVVSRPLFDVQLVEWSVPDPSDYDGLLLTSANAVNMAGGQLERLRALPVHAVGEATAVAAEVAGFGIATIGRGGIDDLLAGIDVEMRLLHLCGEERRTPEGPARPITAVTVYRSNAIEGVDLAALQGQVGMVHSPRAAKRLSELVDAGARATVTLASISRLAADEAGKGWKDVRIATAPTDTDLLALAARLCQT